MHSYHFGDEDASCLRRARPCEGVASKLKWAVMKALQVGGAALSWKRALLFLLLLQLLALVAFRDHLTAQAPRFSRLRAADGAV